MGRVSGADAWGTGFRGWGPRGLGKAWEEMGARLGPERPELLLPLLPLPFRHPSLALSLCPAAVPETARLGSCRRSPAAARPPRPAWARQAERGKSERRGGAAGSRSSGQRSYGEPGWQRPPRRGDAGDRGRARVCGVVYTGGEDAVAVGGWGRVVVQLGPSEPPRNAGWRRPGQGNLAFGGMNEELWKRLPTPCERIGQRARACVRVCLAFGAVWSWARLLDCPVAVLGSNCPPARPTPGERRV